MYITNSNSENILKAVEKLSSRLDSFDIRFSKKEKCTLAKKYFNECFYNLFDDYTFSDFHFYENKPIIFLNSEDVQVLQSALDDNVNYTLNISDNFLGKKVLIESATRKKLSVYIIHFNSKLDTLHTDIIIFINELFDEHYIQDIIKSVDESNFNLNKQVLI